RCVGSGQRAEGGFEDGARVVEAVAGGLPAQLEGAGAADDGDALIVELIGGEPGDAGVEVGVERDDGGGLAGLGVDDPENGGGDAGAIGDLEGEEVVAAAADRLGWALEVQAGELAAGPGERAGLEVEQGEGAVGGGRGIEAGADPRRELEELEARRGGAVAAAGERPAVG